MKPYDHLIERLVNNVHDKHDAEKTAEKLSAYGTVVIDSIIEYFHEAGPSGKCGMIQTIEMIRDLSAIPFLKEVAEDENELIFVQAYAEGVLQELESHHEKMKRMLKNLKKKKGIDLIKAIAALGTLEDPAILPHLEALSAYNQKVSDQISVAVLQIKHGIQAVADEYKNKNTNYNKNSLGIAIYHSPQTKEAARIIKDELFSSTNFFSLSDAIFAIQLIPREEIDMRVKNRLFDILEGDYLMFLRSSAVETLGKVLNKSDKIYLQRLQKFLDDKKYHSTWKFWKWPTEKDLKEEVELAIRKIKRTTTDKK